MDIKTKTLLGIEDVLGEEDLVYLRASDCRVLERGANRLVVRPASDTHGVHWALLDCVSSEYSDGSPDQYHVTMHGWGTGDPLREARHTWVGDDGYVFYVDPSAIAWAFDCLREWFDFDGDE